MRFTKPRRLDVRSGRRAHPAAFLAALGCFIVLATPALADSILFKDGRFIEVPNAQASDTGITVRYENGTVLVPHELIEEFFILDPSGAFTPRNDEEKAKLEEGLVPFEGKWIPATRRDKLVADRQEQRQQRLEEYREHMLWRSRYKDSTKHFNFEYTVPPDVAENYREMFEVFYTHISKEWGMRQSGGKKLKVCFYNNRKDFERIGNVPTGVLGYFRFVDPIELNFFYERRDERMTLDVLFHEANHYMMFLYTKKGYTLPPWIEEGLAEYYGASIWDPQKKTLSIGHIQEGRLVRMQDAMDGGDTQGLLDLMREPSIDAMQYAWAWSLNHMLLEDRKYKSNYRKFVQKMSRDKLKREPWPRNPNFQWVKPDYAISMFQKMLKIKDLKAFESQWYEYIRSMDVKSSRGYYEAGLFCMRWNRPVRATLYFKKALEMGTDNPSVYEELGKVLSQRKKYSEAIDVLQDGLKIDPLNAHLHMALGTAHIRSGKNKELGESLQRLAIEIDPDDNSLLTQVEGFEALLSGGLGG